MALTRIVIVGAGFGGVACAQRLTRRLRRADAEIVLFSRENHFVYNPLLAEAVGASLNPLDVVVPLRELVRGAFCRTEEVRRVDLAGKRVFFEGYDGQLGSMAFDHLVLAPGNVANLGEIPGMADHAFPLKTVGDAIALRAHVLDQLEWAEVCEDAAQRRWHLSFVVVGGGYSGVEVAGEINDLVRGTRRLFRNVRLEDVRVTLVHSRAQILPEIGSDLRDFARRRMERAGVEVITDARVAFATPDGVGLKDGRFLRAATIVSTVGTRPAPIVDALDVAKEKGRIVVGPDLRVPGHDAVWALGDGARVPDTGSGDACPATAQFADRQGRHVADNVAAALSGRETLPFAYAPVGQLCCIGGHRAVAELFGFQVSGVLAWLLWRAVYVAKLPAWSRRLQVAFDWAWLALFPRDLSHVRPRVTERVTHAHYAPGDFVFVQGDAARAFYVVERGELEVIRPTPTHPEGEVVALLGPDAFFGEQALVTDRPRAASVRARTDVDVLVMGRDVFTQISKRLVPLRDAFARVIAARSVDLWAERADLAAAFDRMALEDVLEPVPQPLLAPTTQLREAMTAFAATASEALIVSADGVRADAVVTMADLLRAVGRGASPAAEVGSIVAFDARVLTTTDRVTTAALVLQAQGDELIPVVQDAHDRRLVGCVRLRRLLREALARLDGA